MSEIKTLQAQIDSLKLRVAYLERELLKAKEIDVLNRDMYSEIRTIADLVAERTTIPITDIRSDRRDKRTTEARHILMFLASKHTGMSLPQIGKFLRRDHTSVWGGRNKIAGLMGLEVRVKNLVEEISSELSLTLPMSSPQEESNEGIPCPSSLS